MKSSVNKSPVLVSGPRSRSPEKNDQAEPRTGIQPKADPILQHKAAGIKRPLQEQEPCLHYEGAEGAKDESGQEFEPGLDREADVPLEALERGDVPETKQRVTDARQRSVTEPGSELVSSQGANQFQSGKGNNI